MEIKEILIIVAVVLIVLIIFGFVIFMINRDYSKKYIKNDNDMNIFDKFINITNKLRGKYLYADDCDLKEYCENINNIIIEAEKFKDINYFKSIFINGDYNIVNIDDNFKNLLYVIGVNIMSLKNDKLNSIVYGFSDYEYDSIYFLYMLYSKYNYLKINDVYKIIIGYTFASRLYSVLNSEKHIIKTLNYGKQSMVMKKDFDDKTFVLNNVNEVYDLYMLDFMKYSVIHKDLFKKYDFDSSMKDIMKDDKDFILNDPYFIDFYNVFLIDKSQNPFYTIDKELPYKFNTSIISLEIFYNENVNNSIFNELLENSDYDIDNIVKILKNNSIKLDKSDNGNFTQSDFYKFICEFDFTKFNNTNDVELDECKKLINKVDAIEVNKDSVFIDIKNDMNNLYSEFRDIARKNVDGPKYTFNAFRDKFHTDNKEFNIEFYNSVENIINDTISKGYLDNSLLCEFHNKYEKTFNSGLNTGIIISDRGTYVHVLQDMHRSGNFDANRILASKYNIYMKEYYLIIATMMYLINNSETVTYLLDDYLQGDSLEGIFYLTGFLIPTNISIYELLDDIVGSLITLKSYLNEYINSNFFKINRLTIDIESYFKKKNYNEITNKFFLNKVCGFFNFHSNVFKRITEDPNLHIYKPVSSNIFTVLYSPFRFISTMFFKDGNPINMFIGIGSYILGLYKSNCFFNNLINYISALPVKRSNILPIFMVKNTQFEILYTNSDLCINNTVLVYKSLAYLFNTIGLYNFLEVNDVYRIYEYSLNNEYEKPNELLFKEPLKNFIKKI